MCQNDIYDQIIDKYLSDRHCFIEKEWLTLKSCWKRSKGNRNEFSRLRKKDIENQKDFEMWLKSYISENISDLAEMKKYLIYLENHRSKLKFRVSALTIMIGVFGIILGYISSLKLPQYKEWIVFSLFLAFGMWAYSEQLKNKDYDSAYKEIINLLNNLTSGCSSDK